ncbi:DeoR/GlpR family DNA-binding transcription regulator [Ignavigranum ruoffiae]|uniref:DeoR/GlpR family DNA-binding transcription regulator n=1 Tax=Ignavigranum ruoffiae TaxID=89093 RepID=UPI003B0032C3
MKIERQNNILELLNLNSYLSVTELSDKLKVSKMTIRRDINELSDIGKLKKVYGGAQGKENTNKILTTVEKSKKNIVEKKYIGQIMRTLIHPNDTIFLGAGTTVLYSLEFIDFKDVTVLTTNLLAFNWLVEHHIKDIYLAGGQFFEKTGEFYGSHAENFFNIFNIDKAFHTTNGLTLDFVSTSTPSLAQLQQKVLKVSKINYLLADSTKFNYLDSVSFANTNEFDGIVTDKNIACEIYNEYSSRFKIYN